MATSEHGSDQNWGFDKLHFSHIADDAVTSEGDFCARFL